MTKEELRKILSDAIDRVDAEDADFGDLMNIQGIIFPGGSVEEDLDGQLVVYTGLQEKAAKLVDFEAE
jgi:hypothetical protein